jgi:hypothetical protein
MVDERLVVILSGLQAPGRAQVALEGVEVAPQILETLRSYRCFFCVELDHVEGEAFGFVPMAPAT